MIGARRLATLVVVSAGTACGAATGLPVGTGEAAGEGGDAGAASSDQGLLGTWTATGPLEQFDDQVSLTAVMDLAADGSCAEEETAETSGGACTGSLAYILRWMATPSTITFDDVTSCKGSISCSDAQLGCNDQANGTYTYTLSPTGDTLVISYGAPPNGQGTATWTRVDNGG
jgi:hypothetical protein